MTRVLVTGGSGFIGSALVHRLVRLGHDVRVLDNLARGDPRRLADVASHVEIVSGDVRQADTVRAACERVEVIWHLAALNGTANFYRYPDVVLNVGIRGMLNIIDGAAAAGVRELFVASSSEVYGTPSRVPTDETVPLTIADPHNPRFSYAGSKLASELLALHASGGLARVVVFRPHNVYGPDMGWEHVIPQLIVRIVQTPAGRPVRLPIQGSGEQTRAFAHVDDVVDGLLVLLERGSHLGIYNVGSEEEITIAELARRIAKGSGREVEIVPGPPAAGATERRCPDISKLRALGYEPRIGLEAGLPSVIAWYEAHAAEVPAGRTA